MAEKGEQQNLLSRQTDNEYHHVDVEFPAVFNDHRRNKRRKCLLYLIIFSLFQVGVIALFGMTIAKFRNPKVMILSPAVAYPFAYNSSNPPSFNVQVNYQLRIKNTNFGSFKYKYTTVDFYYLDRKVGEGFVWGGEVNERSSKTVNNVAVALSSTNVTDTAQLAKDLSRGVLPLRSRSRLSGRVKIMPLLKKNKNANMDCNMDLKLGNIELQNIVCG